MCRHFTHCGVEQYFADDERLWRSFAEVDVCNGEILPDALGDWPSEGLSCDRAKYWLGRGSLLAMHPGHSRLASVTAQQVRTIRYVCPGGQALVVCGAVWHHPCLCNRAHTELWGVAVGPRQCGSPGVPVPALTSRGRQQKQHRATLRQLLADRMDPDSAV